MNENKVNEPAPERKPATEAEVEAVRQREVVRALLLGQWLANGGRL